MHTILLAVALQPWEQHRAHALAVREVATALARGTSQQLHVLSVYDYTNIDTFGLPPAIADAYRDEQRQRLDVSLEQRLQAYVAPVKAAGIWVSQVLRVGKPRDVIVQVATEIGADLLIIGTRSKRGLWDMVLGSTARQVRKHAPCPVLLVTPKRDDHAMPVETWRTEDEICRDPDAGARRAPTPGRRVGSGV